DPRFARYETEAAAILTDPGRIPFASPMGDHVYNTWQDREHPYGVWRRSPIDAYFAGEPEWETLIDLDLLSEKEGKPWFLADTSCRLPESSRCLVYLSRRSMDASEVREFDVDRGEFVEDGFALPEFKSRVWWEDDDTVLVAADWGPDSLTHAGYPRSLRRWRRGTPVADAEVVFEVEPERPRLGVMLVGAAGAGSFVAVRPDDFFVNEYWLVGPEGERKRLPLPSRMIVYGSFGDALLLRLNQDWAPEGADTGPFPSGALVAIARQALVEDGAIRDARLVYTPSSDQAVREVTSSGDQLYLGLLEGYRSRVLIVTREGDGFAVEPLNLEGSAFVTLRGPGPTPGSVVLSTEGPLEPPRLWLVGPKPDTRELIAEAPAQFDATGLEATILETTSRDGTPIHYTVVAREGVELDGSHPTLIYGYGGYDVPLTPRYEPLPGKLWLEPGGVYVHAYLRGGGERGPAWHQGAMLKNRQQPYDDMNAVIDDLHRRGYSSAGHTGIMGRSNGGLMVAVVMEQIPEKLGAVVVGGPLIDMLRFPLLPPGASWTAEYGRPDDPEMRDFLAGYSPYQNLRRDESYPAPLIITSTWDDRVLPGHARRFAAKLEALGHDAYYFEDEQGGHYWELAGGPHPGDWRLRARARAVEFTYLAKQLGNDSEASP
ncbi:MAG TPA: prolyl oligopeptidase family serine peptidase, partial [Vicinamibacteria bacterium]|nr:prolyl oligopeptidase family serine peptidase [Vicinamibacteria bacterium]